MKHTLVLLVAISLAGIATANVPGGGTGTGPNVTLVDNGGTVTIGNGIVSFVCAKSSAQLTPINYTFDNGGGTQTLNVVSGNSNGGKLYWENNTDNGPPFTNYWVVASSPDYVEIALFSSSTSVAADFLEVHFSMLRGSPGFYVTAIYGHRSSDGALAMGENRDNIYAGSIFNWMSVDDTRNRLMQVSGGSSIGVLGAPVEVSLWTSGLYQGQYEDKYKYSATFGTERVWGWSSVGSGSKNIGLWDVNASVECYNGGPMKPELMSHIGTTILNMYYGNHYHLGEDGTFSSGEVWTKVYGPHLIYCNNITNSITQMDKAASMLYSDAVAQAAAEATAWPYNWFTNANYALPSGRGAVSGQIVINDAGNPNASASNLWVGVVRQPITNSGSYDFQSWMKPYQFWVLTDSNGLFTIPNVIATNNYTLWAFGPGANGTFMSQNQTGGNPPLLYDLPAVPFSVTVTGGATNNLGTITWTPSRVGATVFEIGYLDRTARKFRHGDDWWVGDIGPSPTAPSPVWDKFLEYPFDFPNEPNYIVGQSRWSTDWNYVQPTIRNPAATLIGSTSTITFNLATAPTNGTQGSLYIAVASADSSAMIVSVNGNNLGSASGVTAAPSSLPSTGYVPKWDASNTTVREGVNAAFSDERITFPASLLHAGQNTIALNMRNGGNAANHVMYDYIRLELTGYVPPPPTNVVAYSGNNANLVCWPVTPGATGYNIFSTTTSGSGYALIAGNAAGPVCGSGINNATYLDTNAVNGTTYYYVVQSLNPGGTSSNSIESAGVAPSAGASTNPPAAPTGLAATVGHGTATLTWSAPVDANFYTIQRSTIYSNYGGSMVTLSTITLNNNITGTTFTDATLTDGSFYRYTVSATSAAGTSSNSTPVQAKPVPPAPTVAPSALKATSVNSTNINVSWSPVSGAVGYIVQSATSLAGPYTFQMSVSETNFLDTSLNYNATYYYEVAAMNAGGTSTNTIISITTPPAAPSSLSATPGNAQILLNWSSSAGATNYIVKRGTSSGNENTTVTNVTGTSFANTGLSNGTTYYYIVVAAGVGGNSLNSPEASAVPVASGGGGPGANWIDTITSSAQSWNVNTNWDPATFPSSVQATATVSSAIAASQTINLNQGIAVGSLNLGASGGAFTIAANTGSLTFDNTPNPATLVEVAASSGDTISAPMTVASSLAVTNLSANTLTLSGTISGGSLTVNGIVTLSGTNSFSGGTTVNSGTLSINATLAGGTGTIALNGSVLNNSASIANSVSVSGNATLNTGNNQITGTWSGNGTLNINIASSGNTFTVGGTMTNFSGTFAFGNSPGFFRFNNTTANTTFGSSTTTFDLGTGSVTLVNRNGAAIELGALAGGSGTTLSGQSSGTGSASIYYIGGKNLSTTFSGRIVNGGGPVSIVKVGTGTLTLAGANTYSGSTTVSTGALVVTSGLGTGSFVTVLSKGTLGGTGTISQPVTVNGTLAPGNPQGTLTISNNLIVNSGATLSYGLGINSDLTAVSSNLTLAGTLNVTDSGGFGAGTYVLFSYGKTLTYNGVSIGSVPSGFNYAISTATAGQVNLLVSLPLSAFQQWQMNYFSCTNCPQAAGDADADGDGMSNTNEFLAGTDPTNSASAFRVLSVAPLNDDIVVTWQTVGSRTNAAQATSGDYNTNFADISAPIIITGSGDATTNFVHPGGATNAAPSYYRIRLVP